MTNSIAAPATVTLKDAAEKAKAFLATLEKDNLIAGPIKNVVLEEVARTESGDWSITLGYRIPTGNPLFDISNTWAPQSPPVSQLFRVFTIDATTGDIIAVKIRGSI